MKIDLTKLEERCEASIAESFADLESEGGTVVTHRGRSHGFLDRGSTILAVAHLDFVYDRDYWFKRLDGDKISCPRLDDRLGVYTILDFLPTCAVDVDVLLTEDEEIGMSTASHFRPQKEYRWIVEFDRRGVDVVTYEYKWGNRLSKYFNVGVGTHSDIAHLTHLGCLGLNVGVGYHHEHSQFCYFSIKEWQSQMVRFLRFYKQYKHGPRLFHTNIRGTDGLRRTHRSLPRRPAAGSSR